MTEMRNEEDVKKRIGDLEAIISGLEHNAAFKLVLEDKKRTVEFCDNSWHRINLDDKDKLLELKYAKLGAEHMLNTIAIYKQELESLQQHQGEDQGYYDDE